MMKNIRTLDGDFDVRKSLKSKELNKVPQSSVPLYLEDARPAGRKPIEVDGKRVGRNSPCPCGSGRKTKHCHKHVYKYGDGA